MALFDGVVASWKLDDLTDATGRGNTLTNNNSVTFNTGKIGNAGYFTAASSQFLSIVSNSDVQTGDIDFTIGGWVYLASKPVAANMIMIGKDNSTSGNREYSIQWDFGTDRFRFDLYQATDQNKTVSATTFGAPSTATWYCIIAYFDSATHTLGISVNDGTVDTFTTGLLQSAGSAKCEIGAREYSGFENYWDGRIDNVNLWKRVLSAQERTDFYNGGAGIEFSSGASSKLLKPNALRPAIFSPGIAR